MGQPSINNFNNDLNYSLDKREDDLLNRFYNKAFPNIERIEFVSDLSSQKRGIDKIIYFKSGKQVTIDEKKRRKDYGDILLEIWSVLENKKRGWLYTCQCDYIVYIVLSIKRIYLLPALLLKKAWNKNKEKWLTKYRYKDAINKGYTTRNIPIPANELLEAITEQMTADVEDQ